MKHDDLENDALWELLRQSPARQARPSFAADTVRAARLSAPDKPWWVRALLPLATGGLLAGAAAVAIAVIGMQHPKNTGGITVATTGFSADVQDYAESQALAVAADHLSDYSDDELVSLVGF